jgi:hypothetical protein
VIHGLLAIRPPLARRKPIPYPSSGEFAARAIAFGLFVAGIAAIVLAGAWWTACIAAARLLLAIAGLVGSALSLGALSAIAIVVAA